MDEQTTSVQKPGKEELTISELKFLLPLVSNATVRVIDAALAVSILNKLARLLDNAQ